MRVLRGSVGGWAASAFLFLSACGGGGGAGVGDGGGGTPGPDPATVLTPKASFSTDDVGHLLQRTRFGVTPADLSAVQQQGVPSFVDSMLVFTPGSQVETDATASEILDTEFPEPHELARWWLRVMQETPNPFQEELALFWHDHFATSQEILGSDKRYWYPDHLDLFRHGGAGNLRQLLYNVAQDWTILEWLDGVRSSKGTPNENFAREFWELFTLGVDNGYTQTDIEQAARCFTGFRTRFDDATDKSFISFDPTRHDTGNKSLLGTTVMGRSGADAQNEYRDMVDVTLANRPVAEYICRRLFEYFVYPNAPQSVVDELAALLRSSNYELAPVLATMFKSEAFYSPAAKAGIAKNPVEFALGFVRSTGMHTHMDDLDTAVTNAGQRPTMPPNVNGWVAGSLWFGSQAVVERGNFARTCVTHRNTDAQTGLDLRALLPQGATTTAAATVDALAALLRVRLTPADVTALTAYLNTQRQSNGTVVDSPFDASVDTQIDERVRGLLYILAQHPTYQVR